MPYNSSGVSASYSVPQLRDIIHLLKRRYPEKPIVVVTKFEGFRDTVSRKEYRDLCKMLIVNKTYVKLIIHTPIKQFSNACCVAARTTTCSSCSSPSTAAPAP